MNPLKENPRLITFLILVLAFVYCAHFTRGLASEIWTYQNQDAAQIESTEITETSDSFSKTVNSVAKQLSERIAQAIRQTSHFIGS